MEISIQPAVTLAGALLVGISIAWVAATRLLFQDDDKDLWRYPPAERP